MAEWPVRVVPWEGRTYKRKPIPPGSTTELERGESEPVKGYHFQCPCCGVVYWVPVTGENVDGPEWTSNYDEAALTLHPSLLCNNPDGSRGHYWLTDGVLREV